MPVIAADELRKDRHQHFFRRRRNRKGSAHRSRRSCRREPSRARFPWRAAHSRLRLPEWRMAGSPLAPNCAFSTKPRPLPWWTASGDSAR